MLVVPGVGVFMGGIPAGRGMLAMRLMIVRVMVVVMHTDTSQAGGAAG